jgi:hypothetical protein
MEVSVEVPLHARYGVPIPGESFSGSTGNYRDIVIGFPEAFMACSTFYGPWVIKNVQSVEDESLLMPMLFYFLKRFSDRTGPEFIINAATVPL